MADLLDWLRPQGAGVASSSGTLPPAMPGQTPRLPPPVSSPFSDVMGSPAFQLGYPLVASVISGLFPNRGARAVAGLSAGINTANYFNQLQRQQAELQKQEEDKKVLGTKLGDYLGGQKLVPPAPFEGQPTEGPANQVPVVADSAHKRLAQALIEAGQPAAALKFLEAEKDKPMLNVAPGHSIVDPTNFESKFTAPVEAKPPTYSYHSEDVGDQRLQYRFNPQTGQAEPIGQPIPKSLAPGGAERLQALQDRVALATQHANQANANAGSLAALRQAEADLARARIEHLQSGAGGGGAVTETVSERDVKPGEKQEAERTIAKTAIDRGVKDLAGWKAIAKEFGYKLTGSPSLFTPGMASRLPIANRMMQTYPSFSGDFQLEKEPTTKITTKAPSGGGAAPAKKKDNDPLGIR